MKCPIMMKEAAARHLVNAVKDSVSEIFTRPNPLDKLTSKDMARFKELGKKLDRGETMTDQEDREFTELGVRSPKRVGKPETILPATAIVLGKLIGSRNMMTYGGLGGLAFGMGLRAIGNQAEEEINKRD